jgi:hypothetical protein
MKLAGIATACAVVFTSPLALAQNAGTGSTATSGDAAVSPATPPANGASSATTRPSAGGGINSGAMNNGTTGDTIGTGSGTSSTPAPGAGATSPGAGSRKE